MSRGTHCPQLIALHIHGSSLDWCYRPLTIPHTTTLRLNHLSYSDVPEYDYYMTGDRRLKKICAMQIERLKHLDLGAISDGRETGMSPDDFHRSRQTKCTIKILRRYGRPLESLTLRWAYLTAQMLEAVLRACPMLSEIKLMYATLGGPIDSQFCLRSFLSDINMRGETTWETREWEEKLEAHWRPFHRGRTQVNCRLHRHD